MVYIYGGRFMFGDASFSQLDFQQFVEKGIIAVSFNFRSGVLGIITSNVLVLMLKYFILLIKRISYN